MAELTWYTIKVSLTGIQKSEIQESVIDFQNLFDSFPHLKNIKVALEENNMISIQLDAEDLSNLELSVVGERASEEILDNIPAVLRKPSGVKVGVLDVSVRNST